MLELLYDEKKLPLIDESFQNQLPEEILHSLKNARKFPDDLNQNEEFSLIYELAPHFEKFIANLFKIEGELEVLKETEQNFKIIHEIKRKFIQKRVAKNFSPNDISFLNEADLRRELLKILGKEQISQIDLCKQIEKSLETQNVQEIEVLEKFCAIQLHKQKKSVLFSLPERIDFENLIAKHAHETKKGLWQSRHEPTARKGFSLSDEGAELDFVLDQTAYCIFCHKQGKDSCSKGLPSEPAKIGCPLEEKISEMNFLKFNQFPIASLGTALIDNPMIAGTGHRICNDCMKSCIYQKQEAVDVPQIETRVLKDILSLPYGFEIYSLLTRWNPLNFKNFLPKAETGKKILIAGMGPAGFTLAHHLLNEGHIVVGIDGLKIEPLKEEILSISNPIKWINDIKDDLENRDSTGFGGVSEYGITVRWDKNFLKIIRLLLERRKNFRLFDSVRLGSNISHDQAFELGFDHVALCIGAGKPTILNAANSFARGIRTASDFLMTLQLARPFKESSIANLQVRLPAIVIGGGLTAIDTATEILAYYPKQVEKFLVRFEKIDQNSFWQNLDDEEKIIAEEFIKHAKEIRFEREESVLEGREAKILDLLRKWGGVKICYRNSIKDSPSYKLNPEELSLAFQEGIEFCENVTPSSFNLDEFGHVKSMTAGKITIPAKSVMIAAGTSPNITPHFEVENAFEIDGKFFTAFDENLNQISPEKNPKTKNLAMLTKFRDKFQMSFFGDLHPSFAGNVVKAMASAKRGYPIISKILSLSENSNKETREEFFAKLNQLLVSKIHEINRLGEKIVELVIHSPMAAKNFQPGQFFRLQNYEIFAPKVKIHGIETSLAFEGLALTGAWKNEESGLISTIILEMGGSSNICSLMKKGEKISLMGPTGTATKIKAKAKILLVGGGLGNAVLFSIGKALKEAGSEVIYFAAYRKNSDIFKMSEIEKASTQIVWCSDEGIIEPRRKEDSNFTGNIVNGLRKFANGEFEKIKIKISEIDEMIVIGSDGMMNAVNEFRTKELKKELNAIASINSPMNCMMKEICGQCLQKHLDHETGLEFYIYSCVNQDQCMNSVDFNHLKARLKSNSLQEKMTKEWLKFI